MLLRFFSKARVQLKYSSDESEEFASKNKIGNKCRIQLVKNFVGDNKITEK